MWSEDLLPLYQEQHLSFAPWGLTWCKIQSEGNPADPDTWKWDLVDKVVRLYAGSGIEPVIPVETGDCAFTADTEIEDSHSYPPAQDRWDDWYRFVVALADRYDGTHPDSENAGQTLPRVRYFELVAENDQPTFWGGTPEEMYGFDAAGNPIAATVQVAPGLTLPKALLPIFYAGIHHDPAREAYVIAGSHTTIYAMGSRLVERKRDALQGDGELSPADIQELLGFARLIYTYYEDHDTNHLVDSPNPRQFPDYADLELWLDQTARYRSFIDPFFDAHAYYDVVGLHNFLGYQAFEDYLAYVRQEMRDHGIDGYPVWITELGHIDSDRACWLAIFCTPTQPDGQETETEHAQSMEKKLVLAAHFGAMGITYSPLIEFPPPASPCVDDDVDSPHPCVLMGGWSPYEVIGTTLVISDTIPLEAADALRFASGVFNADFAYQSRRENLSPRARLYVFDGDDRVNHVAVGWCEVCGEGETHNVDAALRIGAGTPIAVYDYLGNLLGDPYSHAINFTQAPVFTIWQSTATPTSTASPTSTPTATPTPTSTATPTLLPYEDSPFGFLPANVNHPDYDYPAFADAQNIGVRWHRPAVAAFWFLIQPDLNDPTYDWSLHDQQYGSVPAGIHILANISPDHWLDTHGYTQSGSYLPVDEVKYRAFVRATVDRYNGDGDGNDMPGLTNPIKYWQVDNEPKANLTGFADLQRITYQAIKDACPDCTVLIGGSAGFPDDYIQEFDAVYGPILSQLAGQYVDVFDFHWYGTATGEYRLRDSVTGEDVYAHVRASLAANGYSPDLPIWITEMGSYSGDPAEPQFSFQSERQQASDIFRRYTYALSRGVKKVFSAFGLMEDFGPTVDGYFDHTGLIYDGEDSNDLGLGVKKLGYYTYKKMTEQLEGADWSTLTTLHDGTDSDHLYLFRVTKGGRPIYIAWWDTFDEPGYTPGNTKPIMLTGLTGTAVTVTAVVPSADTGQEVTDYATAFSVATYPVSGGSVTIPVGEDPVLVEEIPPPASQCVGDVNGNGIGDVVDIQSTAAELGCRVYLPLVAANWRQPWPTETPTATPTPSPTPTPTATPQAFQLQHLRTVTLTTDAEGGGGRPEIVYANDRFFVVYLGNIIPGSGQRAFKVKVFDQDLTTEIMARDLVTPTAEYGSPTDIRVASDGQYLYAFYEMAGEQQGTHLFAAKYALTDDFPRVAYTDPPIAGSVLAVEAQPGDELLDDPAPVLANGSLFVMTKIRTGITPDEDTRYRLRQFTTDLTQVGEARDLDLSQVADGGANVNALLYVDGNYYGVLPTTIAPMCGPGGGPEAANSDLLMVRFDPDWTFDPATDVWTLSDCPDMERYVSGFDHADGYFYVAHHATPRTWTCQQGGPSPGRPPGEVVWLKVFDADFNPVDAVKVSGDVFGNHPTVEVVGERVYVAYGHKETQDASENVVVEIYQKVPRQEGYQPQFCSEGSSAPTLATCQAWIQENHSLDYPDHGCQEHTDILNAVASNGAGAIPLGDSKFFITWFPDDWENLTNRKLIVTLHGSGGCTERVYQWWARPASERNYALVALQYARQDETTEEGYAFDDSDQIYANLRTVFDQLQTYCPLDDTAVVYHGFSRGSARSFKMGLLDRAEDGMNLFSAFIADSGTELAETGGEIPAYLQDAPPDAYSGAPYWLYCGGQDHDGQTCDDMRRLGPVLEEHGATVTTYRYEPGGHGIFSTVQPGGPPSPALNAMFEYIDALEAR
jgi:predicted esterase